VKVVVKENLFRWSNWKILTKTHEFIKEDSRTITFPVEVPKDGETFVRYRVRYTW
jgi:small-conductance mechanosensitive channel